MPAKKPSGRTSSPLELQYLVFGQPPATLGAAPRLRHPHPPFVGVVGRTPPGEALAFGIFMWNREERITDRYGAIHLSDSTYEGVVRTIRVVPTLDRRLLDELSGQRVRLTARVDVSRRNPCVGDRYHNIAPSRPRKGEVIELGVGRLFVEVHRASAFTPELVTYGVQPADNRETLWFDPRRLYRLHNQTVTLFAEQTTDPDLAAPDL